MKILRITNREKPMLDFLQVAWESPDEQDIPTEDIIKWLRQNLHRKDVGLWVAIDEGAVVGCLIATGPTLLFPGVHVYTAWVKKGSGIKTQEFFEGNFIEWVRSMGCNEISICSAAHSGRSLEKRYGFKGYSRVYRRSLEPLELGLEPVKAKEINNA